MQDQSNQTNPQPTPEDTAQNASTPASQEAGNGQQERGWKQKIQTLLKKCTIPFVIVGALFVIVGALFLIVGVPIIINELYKRPGYVTMWSAADMLGYYGTLLGAFVGIATLVMTIWFTRCQIQREGYLQSEKEKWGRIEQVFADALQAINPRRAFDEAVIHFSENPMVSVERIQRYQFDCRTSTDQLNMFLSNVDYPKVENLIEEIRKSSDKYCEITQRCIELYTLLARYSHRSTAENTLKTEKQCPNSFPFETIEFCENLLKQTNEIKYNELQDEIFKVKNEMLSEYQLSFRELLRLKGSKFDLIYSEMQNEADSILSPWRKH